MRPPAALPLTVPWRNERAQAKLVKASSRETRMVRAAEFSAMRRPKFPAGHPGQLGAALELAVAATTAHRPGSTAEATAEEDSEEDSGEAAASHGRTCSPQEGLRFHEAARVGWVEEAVRGMGWCNCRRLAPSPGDSCPLRRRPRSPLLRWNQDETRSRHTAIRRARCSRCQGRSKHWCLPSEPSRGRASCDPWGGRSCQ